ncbi:sensor histidine kinase [Cuneatibacter caecimuris]|uniref:HAMP domain-containing protein n=1 Tax=Cuneatibacter caecimuris TaxID=1796618 RepID=A0A4V2F7N1_9FIRM|nr:histidine kinase [Cuneatibacter caecimuris]RZT00400.1 HAMP domain-containing protein [Cuneatibacter caecimuris]
MKKKTFSLKGRLVQIIFIGWFVPILLLIVVLGWYMRSNYGEQMLEGLSDQLYFTGKICAERVDTAVTASRASTYDRKLWELYQRYTAEELTPNGLYLRTSNYIFSTYQKEKAFQDVYFWYTENPEVLNYSMTNTSSGGKYEEQREYWVNDHQEVKEIAKTLGTKIRFWQKEDKLYMIRNLMSPEYEHFGTIVMRLNPDYILENLKDFSWSSAVTVYLDSEPVVLSGKQITMEEAGGQMKRIGDGVSRVRGDYLMYEGIPGETLWLGIVMEMDSKMLSEPFVGYWIVVCGMLLMLLVMLALLTRVFRSQVVRPVSVLMRGAEEIEKGNYGGHLEEELRSREFQYLEKSFNQMSDRLKYQFEHIYKEELALRDARIVALQSNINPHFLNNTLEIINWEARMSGNVKVPKMIEALSTLMNAAMDRKKKPLVRLAEEMSYVNAYLYIAQERLGKRLTVVKELDQEMMDYEVPRLIMQPLIENAVKHGVEPRTYGTIRIRVCQTEENLTIEIINDGTLTKEDEQRVARLLDPEYDSSKEPSGNLGISNVNMRVKLLYGENSGLTIENGENNVVIARIRLCKNQSEQKNTTNSQFDNSHFYENEQ